MARSFRNKKTQTVGLVFEHFQTLGDRTGYFSQLLNGVMSATFPRDYSLTICPMLIRNSYSGAIFDGRFDGIIWCRPEINDETRGAIENAPVPVVAMHVLGDATPNIATYCCDNGQALLLAVEHLRDLGHDRIAFAVDHANKPSFEARDRMSAFLAAKERLGLATSPKDILVWDHDGCDLEAYWQTNDRHSAFICFSESHAVSLLRKCEELRISVPSELSIIGFDSTSFCETTTPRLTAINQPVEKMAFDATQSLIGAIEGESVSPQSFIYPCGLDIRESTSEAFVLRGGVYTR